MLVVDGLHAAADDGYAERGRRSSSARRSRLFENWFEQTALKLRVIPTANNSLVFKMISLRQMPADIACIMN